MSMLVLNSCGKYYYCHRYCPLTGSYGSCRRHVVTSIVDPSYHWQNFLFTEWVSHFLSFPLICPRDVQHCCSTFLPACAIFLFSIVLRQNLEVAALIWVFLYLHVYVHTIDICRRSSRHWNMEPLGRSDFLAIVRRWSCPHLDMMILRRSNSDMIHSCPFLFHYNYQPSLFWLTILVCICTCTILSSVSRTPSHKLSPQRRTYLCHFSYGNSSIISKNVSLRSRVFLRIFDKTLIILFVD